MDLETLLKRNYYELIDNDAARAVITYIAGHPSAENKGVRFIKGITKVAMHVHKKKPALTRGLSERLLVYTIEALTLLDRGELDGLHEDQVQKMEGHLHAYAGDFAILRYKENNDVNFVGKACRHYGESIKLLADIELGYSSCQASKAAKVSRQMFELTGTVNWAGSWYKNATKARDLTETFDTNRSQKYHLEAIDAIIAVAKASKERYEQTTSLDDAGNWYRAARKAAQMLEPENLTRSAHFYEEAGKASKAFAQMSGETQSLLDSLEMYETALRLVQQVKGVTGPDTRRLQRLYKSISGEDFSPYQG
ncbi:hypothetical protein J4219_07770 [Candidatus Woesearchaeota archaeon]|nr:hypothetical protein [Candidatus Woesearchaeota archaeon]